MAMTVDSLFIDTNILVYSIVQEMPLHQLSRSTLEKLLAQEIPLWISTQVVQESLAVLTRPNQFAQDISPAAATMAVQELLPSFRLGETTLAVMTKLLEIVSAYSVKGKQIHDANIVATMQASGLSNLLTANPKDFQRYHDRIAIFTLEMIQVEP
jgi:predicted nucleic acid-binding protein